MGAIVGEDGVGDPLSVVEVRDPVPRTGTRCAFTDATVGEFNPNLPIVD